MVGRGVITAVSGFCQNLPPVRKFTEKDSIEETDSFFSSDDDKPRASNKNPGFGIDPILKTLYEHPDTNHNYTNWVETPPKQLSAKAARSHDRVSIKVYKIKDLDKPVISGRYALKHHMIEIQNPTLVAELKPILEKEEVYLEPSEVAKFKAPFAPLYFCYDDIRSLHRKCSDATLTPHLELLLKVLDELFGGLKSRVRHHQASGLISFGLAWTYFRRNSIVYSPDKDCERLHKVIKSEYVTERGTTYLDISCQEISFAGESFDWKDKTLRLVPFSGNKPVKDIDHYPLSFHDDSNGVKARLASRGKKVIEYQGLTYCEYKGVGIYADCNTVQKHNVSDCLSLVKS